MKHGAIKAQVDKDEHFIRKTFSLARRAEGFTSPNPLVGAIITKDNRVVATGYHRKSGLPHAEIEAIKSLKKKIKGLTLYVNLEPCYHFGKTPPCVDELLRTNIGRVVIASADPNPKVNTKSIRKLRKSGIKVKVGICKKEAEKLNEVFFKNMRANLPFVVAKIAESLDGKTATKKGISKWITSKKSRLLARSLRDKYDAILVGVNTVISDDPRLTGLRKKPFKIVIDPSLRIPPDARLLKENPEKLIIITSAKKRNLIKNLAAGVKVIFAKERNSRFIVRDILRTLFKAGIMSVFIEGGAETQGAFFDEHCVDKLYFFIAPKIIGGKYALSSVAGRGFTSPNSCPSLREVTVERIGEDLLISGYPYYRK